MKITPRQAMQMVFDILGTKSAVASLCGVSDQAVGQWSRIPIRHCTRLEAAVEGKVTVRQMRPDFPWPVT